MSGHTLPALAALGAIAAVAVAVQLSRADSGEERRSEGPVRDDRAAAPTPTVLEPANPAGRPDRDTRRRAEPDPAREDTDRPQRIDGLRSARRVAHRFLGALLLAERGRGGRSTRTALRALSARGLGNRLLAEPARVPAGTRTPPVGRVAALELLSAGRGRIELAAAIRRGDERSGLILRLTGRGDRWLVSDLR